VTVPWQGSGKKRRRGPKKVNAACRSLFGTSNSFAAVSGTANTGKKREGGEVSGKEQGPTVPLMLEPMLQHAQEWLRKQSKGMGIRGKIEDGLGEVVLVYREIVPHPPPNERRYEWGERRAPRFLLLWETPVSPGHGDKREYHAIWQKNNRFAECVTQGNIKGERDAHDSDVCARTFRLLKLPRLLYWVSSIKNEGRTGEEPFVQSRRQKGGIPGEVGGMGSRKKTPEFCSTI